MFFKKLAPHLLRGQAGERRAAAYLKAQGLSIVANNIRSRYGEIDLIARDGAVLVFVEVRSRRIAASMPSALTARKSPGSKAFSERLAGAGAICYGTNRPLTQAKRSG